MKVKKNQRGFKFVEFKDFNSVDCSIQKSSIATDSCIWFGADEIGLKEFIPFSGWKDRLEFDHISKSLTGTSFVANNRMHLSQSQVKKLLPVLIKFAETGEL